MTEQKEEIELEDVENYHGSGEKTWNPQQLLMQQFELCLKNGSEDTDDTGGWDNKQDKNGNWVKTYREDKRKKYIRSIKSLMGLVHRDYKDDPTYNSKIDALKSKIKVRKSYWLEQEWRWWCSLNPAQRQEETNKGRAANQGSFNKALQFDNFYFDEELELYGEIFELISDFIKDKMYDYTEEELTG